MKNAWKTNARKLLLLLIILGPQLRANAVEKGAQENFIPQITKQKIVDEVGNLKKLHLDYKTAKSTTSKEGLLRDMRKTAQERSRLMEGLVETDPQAALDSAIPASERSKLPREVRDELEEDILLEGDLEVEIADDFERGQSHTYHYINTGKARHSLHFTAEPPMAISGARVRVSGLKVKNKIAVPK